MKFNLVKFVAYSDFFGSAFLQDLSLRGFWLQKWMSRDKAIECRNMIDYLLGLARDGKLTYE